MIRLFVSLCALVSTVALAQPAGAKAAGAPDAGVKAPLTGAELNKTLYALGALVAQRTPVANASFTEAELKEVIKGFSDAAMKKTLSIKMEEYGPRVDELLKAKADARGSIDKKKNDEYLAKAAKEAGVEKLPSGVLIISQKAGTGAQPAPTDTVKVHYRGTLTDGTEFDSSYKRNEPTEFPLNGVIPCWTQGVGKMKVGQKAKLVCPSETAYADHPPTPLIPPNSVLVFEVELISIKGK